MTEQLDLVSASGPQTAFWRVRTLSMERGLSSSGGSIVLDTSKSEIFVRLIGENGRALDHRWTGAAADADIVALNKANLTANTLQRRILSKLLTDGVIAGTISGVPD